MAKNVLGAVRRKFQPWNDPAARPFIEFRAVTKRFGSFVAVDNQTLNIYEREFHALLGPSGCGKTTLLRMLAGFEEPSEGSIWLDGKPLSGVPPHRRPVNMMFQSYALFPHMSVEANVAFGLKQDKLAKPASMRSSVVLPQPEGPSSAKNSPSPMSTETLSTAATEPKRLVTLRTEMMEARAAIASPGGRQPDARPPSASTPRGYRVARRA